MRRGASPSRLCIASLLTLVLAVMSAAECAAAAMTPEQMACCAAMKGDCEKAISSHCCDHDGESAERFVATKATHQFVPAAVVIAILNPPPLAFRTTIRLLDAPEASTSGPPGIPTYLFVSSFRI
jgi:hypothetical protein